MAKEPPPAVEYNAEDYIIDEDAWVIVTRDGWVKRQKSFNDVASIRVREEDKVGWVYRSRARHTVTFFTDRGAAYTFRVNDVPLTTGHGEPIGKHFAFEDGEHVVGVVCHDPRCLPASKPVPPPAHPEPVQQGLLGDLAPLNNGDGPSTGLPLPPYGIALTAGGKVLRFALAAHSGVSTKKGRAVVRLDAAMSTDKVIGVETTDGSENLCLATRSARVLIFPVSDVNVVAGAAKGVTAVKMDSTDLVIGFALANKMREGLTVRTNRGAEQVIRATRYPVTSRGGRGYGILQRGSLDAVIPSEVEPVPSPEQVGEA